MSTLITLVVLLAAPTTVPSPAIADEVSRLAGHELVIASDGRSYSIQRIAREGKPVVGFVELRGGQLWLNAGAKRYRLVGPLAIPRIAGPRYKVWALGQINGDVLRPKRLGILAPPK